MRKIEPMLNRGKIIVIVGAPASGKTYLTEKLAPIYKAEIIYSHPKEGLPEGIKHNLSTQTNLFETIVWFRNIQVCNYRLALSRAFNGINVVMDSPIYQNQLFVELFIKDKAIRRILFQMGKIDLEGFPRPDIVIYISTTKNSLMRYFNERKEKRDWENDSWISLMQKIPAIVDKQMKAFKDYAGMYIRINREDFDFSNQADFDRLLDLLMVKTEKQI